MWLKLFMCFHPNFSSVSSQDEEHSMEDKLDYRLRGARFIFVGVFDDAGGDEIELVDDIDDVEHGVHPSPHEEVRACLRAEFFRHPDLYLLLTQCFAFATFEYPPRDFRWFHSKVKEDEAFQWRGCEIDFRIS